MNIQSELTHPASFLNKLDVPDFANRWCRARLSALHSAQAHALEKTPFLVELKEKSFDPSDHSKSENWKGFGSLIQLEEKLLTEVPVEETDFLLRKVFDNSRNLALSLGKHFQIAWELTDFSSVLPYVGISCFETPWKKHRQAYLLERGGCLLVDRQEDPVRKKLICSYWREALDGLVMGLGETERLARHASRGHGDDKCVDILFNDIPDKVRLSSEDSSAKKSTQMVQGLKFGEVTLQLKSHFESLSDYLKKNKVELVLEGVSEGKLYYQLKAQEGVLCGAGGKLLHDMVRKSCLEFDSKFEPVDASPLAVYGGSS